MKKLLAILLTFSLVLLSFSGCATNNGATSAAPVEETVETILESNTEEVTATADPESPEQPVEIKTDDIAVEQDIEVAEEVIPDFTNLSDPALLQYVEDSIYTDLVASFDSEDYIIKGVNAVYISNEYLEEAAYNSQSNIFFGYTLEELDEEFQGTRYVFTPGEDGATTVMPFEVYDDTYEQVIKNVDTVCKGVILICVVVSKVAQKAGAPEVSMIFAASAETVRVFDSSLGIISDVVSCLVTGYQTDDIDPAVKAAALIGSDGFKWGAIIGEVVGDKSKASAFYDAAEAR